MLRCLVRVDGGVLDDGLAGVRPRPAAGSPSAQPQVGGAVEMNVQVAGWRHFGTGATPSIGPKRVGQLPRNQLRRLAQDARQLERHGWTARSPSSRFGGVLNGDGGQRCLVEAVQLDQPGANPFPERFVQLQES